jgi:NAD(P)-dependent dehydrogenase (short-subunit alcohol dehydrogenase family)
MGQLAGKVALVTGSGRGIGKEIALGLAREGADIVMADINASRLLQSQADILACGVKVEAVPTDVTSEKQIEALFEKTMERFGRLDILVNNAGVFDGGAIDQMSTETWDKVMATDLRAPFLCIRSAFRIMKAQGGGRIINIGSISAQRVRSRMAAYSAAKFALVGLTHTTALEGRPYGITCGCLHPGETYREERPASAPPEPSMQPGEIATAAVYMACQPPHINVLELIQMPLAQMYLGRG